MNNSNEAHSSFLYSKYLKECKNQDVDFIKNENIRNLLKENKIITKGIKDKFYNNFIKKHKNLFCQICGRYNLVRNKTNQPENNEYLATIEHVIPISLGGLKYVETNWIISCYICNNKRGVLPLFKVGDRYKY